MLMGRVLYNEWSVYWPAQPAEDQFAAFMNATPKFVVSTTLDSVEWNNATLINGDVIAEITKLKQQPGKHLTISGSGTLVQSLLHHNLLDELRLMVHPLVVGHGKRLFTDGNQQKALKLVDAQTFTTGVLYLTYQPDRAEA